MLCILLTVVRSMGIWHAIEDFFRFLPFSEHNFFRVERGLPFRLTMMELHTSFTGLFKVVRVGDIGCSLKSRTCGWPTFFFVLQLWCLLNMYDDKIIKMFV